MNRHTAGLLLLAVAPLQFIAATLAAEQLYPGYSPIHNAISDLGATHAPTAPLFNTSATALGAAGLAAAYLLKTRRITKLLLAAASIGAAGVGIYPIDTGTPHIASAALAFTAGAAAAGSLAAQETKTLKTLGLAAAATSLTATALYAADIPTPLGPGGVERVAAYSILLYYATYASIKLHHEIHTQRRLQTTHYKPQPQNKDLNNKKRKDTWQKPPS